jgi:hypothetical protein
MTCDDVELECISESLSDEARAHLHTCPACRQFVADYPAVMAAAAGTLDVSHALVGFEHDLWRRLHGEGRRRRQWWVGYAVAAGLGALVASAGFWVIRPVREVVVERLVERAGALAARETLEPNLFGDEGFFEVTWPDTSEGETQ